MAKKGKKMPAYSSDALALRLIAGLALIALGAVIFLATVLNLPGVLFDNIRTVSYGISGSMALLLPILPLWAGVLVVWSTQRKAPVKPWLFAFVTFIGISTVMVILTRTNQGFWVDALKNGGWNGAIADAYRICASSRMSGGALGMLLGWPVGTGLGTVLGSVLLFPLTLLSTLMIFDLTPKKAADLVTGKISLTRLRQERKHAGDEQQYLAMQQEQERQQQAAYAAQQAWMLQQQQMQQAQPVPQQAYSQPGPQNAYPQSNPVQNPYPQNAYTVPGTAMQQPAQNPAYQSGVEAWMDQVSTNRAAKQNSGHESRLFRKNEEKPPEKKRKSRIFNRGEEYDGLTDRTVNQSTPSEASRRNTAPVYSPVSSTATAAPFTEDSAAVEKSAERPQVPVDPDAYCRPEDRAAKYARPEAEPERKQADTASSAGVQKEPKQQSISESTNRRENVREQKTEHSRQERMELPPVNAIGEETWKPELKLPPRLDQGEQPEEAYWEPTPYCYPPITDLKMPSAAAVNTQEEDEFRSRKLEETLANFRVQAHVVRVTHGPAISRFELELAPGTKVNKVSELEKDIAYGMEATSIRIEAPIPGKSLVGVEVPNRKVNTVTLREVLESDPMQNARSILTVALGRDIAGTPIVCDLAKMPHMLIAGATGSGKSVCINAIINSLLFRASPDDVKLILVDPKVVELQCYNGIPHLLIPVVNDPHKAAAALAWAVAEMMERYDKFAERKVRNLEGYNNSLGAGEKPMPRIVIIIDELADLMMVCKKDVEEYICRLTQLARAAGIHLIVATQRPSVDVITGLIKANIPSRIAFKTASYVDSRTILDRNGSEQLLGWGDMLYLPTGSFAPTRVQGCFLSDEEVNQIAKHVREANPSTYDPDVLDKLEELSAGSNEISGADIIGGVTEAGGGDADLFAQAVEFAIADGQISTSTLQRRLKVGYARAGRLTDEMEERGIVAAKDGSKPRKCLITREQWEEMKKQTEGIT